MTDRSQPEGQPALSSPPSNLRSFPSARLDEGRQVARSHKTTNDPWWFSSIPAFGGGRFDLPAPRGTCYVADSITTAVLERLRETLVRSGVVTTRMADSFIVSLFAIPGTYRCAHIGVAKAAHFGVTRELATLAPRYYPLSQEWADSFDRNGYEGIRYGTRFAPGPANAWAIFGMSGADMRPHLVVNEKVSGREACRRSGIRVQPIPRLSALTVIDP